MPSAGVYPAGGNMMPYGVMPGMSPRGMPGTGGDAGLGESKRTPAIECIGLKRPRQQPPNFM